MLILEFKVKSAQYSAIDEAIRAAKFIQNKCLRFWIDNRSVSKFDLNKYCAVLAKEFSFADELNSMARQASAERAWSAISRFFEEPIGQLLLRNQRVRLVVFDATREVINQWIPQL